MSSYDGGGFDEWLRDSIYGQVTDEQMAKILEVLEPLREYIDEKIGLQFESDTMSWRTYRNDLWLCIPEDVNAKVAAILKGEKPMTTIQELNPRIAVYAGSFDPVTLGHEDIIRRASLRFDTVYVGIGTNSAKSPFFLPGERKTLLEVVCSEITNVKINTFSGLLVNYCKEVRAGIIIRGLRSVSDFESELGIAHVNAQQDDGIETFFLAARPEHAFISSSVARELARHNGNLEYYVHPEVAKAMKKKASG
jgi:pantetheine-phosphate adenylyltransferase